MAGGFSINAMLNASKWLRGVKDMESSLTDLEGALDDATDEVKKLDREGEKGFKELERGAERAEDEASDLEKRLRKVRDEAKDVGKASKDVGDAGKDGFRKMGDSAEEVSSELRQNLGETFSSFRGDLEDLPQIAQDTLGGLAGSGALGGIPGLVATAAGAAGIGLLIAAFDDAAEAQERLKEKSAEWATTFIENGSKVLSTAQIVAKGQDILDNNYDELAENAKLWGVSEETALAAMSGSAAAIDEVTRSMEKKSDAAKRDAQLAQEAAEANGGQLLSLTPLEQEYAKGRQRLDELNLAMENGATRADTYSYFLRDLATNTEGATTKVDEFGDTITTLPDGTVIYIDAETGQATSDVNAIEKKIYGIPDGHANVTVDTGRATAGINNWISQNNGKTIKIYGKYIAPAGSSIP